MPTIGWIHDNAIDKYNYFNDFLRNEESESTHNSFYKCLKCNYACNSLEEIKLHSQTHSLKTTSIPTACINKYEINKNNEISDYASLEKCTKMEFYSCDSIFISKNNTPKIKYQASEIPNLFQSITKGIITIIIANEHIEKRYIFKINIIEKSELNKIDLELSKIFSKQIKDEDKILSINDLSTKFPHYNDYITSINDYIIAILIKDASHQIHAPIDQHTYVQRMEGCLTRLNIYKTELSNTIKTIIKINLNNFITKMEHLSPICGLNLTYKFFSGNIKKIDHLNQIIDSNLISGCCIIDKTTLQIIDLVQRLHPNTQLDNIIKEIENTLNNHAIHQLDKNKFMYLLMHLNFQCKNVKKAKNYAESLVHDPAFSAYADYILGISNEKF